MQPVAADIAQVSGQAWLPCTLLETPLSPSCTPAAALPPVPQNGQALRLGGLSLLDAALCMLSLDPREARAQLKASAAPAP